MSCCYVCITILCFDEKTILCLLILFKENDFIIEKCYRVKYYNLKILCLEPLKSLEICYIVFVIKIGNTPYV